jgi:RNA polymerase sigma-70 factor, ECF subfamily
MQTDAQLVRRVKQGNTDAYETLVLRYQRAATMIAMRVLRDHHRAEDVAQEAFVKAFERLDSLHDEAKFSLWLMQIVKRRALREVRREQRVAVSELAEDPTAEPARSVLDGHEELTRLLAHLPIHEHLVVTLHHLDGRPVAEIAETTGRPVGTVTKQLSRAMRRLQDLCRRQEQML